MKATEYIDKAFEKTKGMNFKNWLLKKLVKDLTEFDYLNTPEQVMKAQLLLDIYDKGNENEKNKK